MAEFQGDYLGFTFGKLNDNDEYDSNCHSSFYGIVRTSSSNRYEDKLNGTLKDNTQARTNADGTFYFGTTISQKQFTVNFAFDHMTETQLNGMKKWLNPKEIKELIFDEDNPNITSGRTLKKWKAKVTGQTSVKHLCFDENNQRIYKGDGSIQFTCYYPYACGAATTIISYVYQNNGVFISSLAKVEGDIEVPFLASFQGSEQYDREIEKGDIWKLKDLTGDETYEVGSIIFNKDLSSTQGLKWNSETGLIKKGNEIIPTSGNTIIKLEPQHRYGIFDKNERVVGMIIEYTPLYY